MSVRQTLARTAIALGSLLLAAPASASFHDMQIREVYPGSALTPNAEYVELQMWAAGQNLVDGHILRAYDSAGTVVGSGAFGGDVPRGANQSTLVLATPEAEPQLGFLADATLVPSGLLDPAGGAVCWESLDCVSWGSFHGALPSSAGPPAAPSGIPDGMALRRTIEPGCPTLLEATDDSGNSSADLFLTFPAPRPNSVAPGEHSCGVRGGGGASTPPGPGAPQTSFRRKPAKRSSDRTATFRFSADQAGSSFECSFDRHRYRFCRSPLTTKPLPPGRHSLSVRARGRTGLVDPSPVSWTFRITGKRRQP